MSMEGVESPPRSGRVVPSALCAVPVSETDFRAGRAKLLQGFLYCAECSAEAERDRLREALEFIMENSAIVDKHKADDVIPSIYHIAKHALAPPPHPGPGRE